MGGGILLYWLLQNLSAAGRVLGLAWSLVFPFILGLFIAYVLNLPMRFFETRLLCRLSPKPRRILGFVLTLVAVLGALALVLLLVVPQLVRTINMLAASMPGYLNNLQSSLGWLEAYVPQLQSYIEQFDWDSILNSLLSWVQNGAGDFFGSVFGVASSIVSGATSFVVGFIFACYLLFGKEGLWRQTKGVLQAYLKEKRYAALVDFGNIANRIFSSFISGQCMEALAVSLMFLVVLWVGRFDYALLISVLIGVTSFIPIFGAFIGCIVGAFLILVSSGFWRALAFVIVFLVVQQIDGNFVYPRIVGNSVGLPALWVLVAVSLGAGLLGIAGMIFFIPLFSVLYVLFKRHTLNRLKSKGLVAEASEMAADLKPEKKPPREPFFKRNKRK